ncbi:hypothetical protein B0H16DRAFT_1520877 [Mycena metata]|uniref:F-box domain-containing protein n=1 Tax=Mycena metata TaxID=1033252 RepID=A0AAD7NN24_9AGAR|nr:hypothetical protein B0H16DRAFT_1520877 [Mycena metata]
MSCTNCGFSVLSSAAIPAAPHPELLISGVPSESQTAEIEAAIALAGQNITAVDAEMEGLQKALEDHSARRRELEEFSLKHQAALSAIRKLPAEVLGEIFSWCRDADYDGELRFDPKWIVTRVCRTWRAAAVSTPRMWDEIQVGSALYTSEACLVLLLSQQIQWSGQLPLSVKWSGPYNPSPAVTHSLVDLFLSVAHRWRSANLWLGRSEYWIPAADSEYHILAEFTGSFPILQKLEFCDTLVTEIPASLSTIFRASPLLQHLKLPLCYRPALHHFPWTQLKTCHFPACTAPDIAEVLRLTSNIVNVSIEGYHRDAWHHGDERPASVTIPTLQTLTVSTYGLESGTLLGALVTPALQRLTVEKCTLNHHQILDFLSHCVLTHLKLDDVDLATDGLLAMLVLLPHLIDLVLHGTVDTHISPSFVKALTCVPGRRPPSLVPHLASLSLAGLFRCPNRVILDMLRSRNAATGSGALRKVIFVPLYVSPVIPAVDELRAEGLDVTCVQPEKTL